MSKFQTPIPHYWDRELKFAEVLRTMESRGVLIDQKMCRKERAIGEAELYRLQTNLGDLSPTSPKAMEKLFRKIGIPLLEDHKTKNGNYSFDKDAMEDYDRLLELRADKYGDTAKRILEFRGWTKVISSNYNPYLELVSPDGRLRCNFNQGGTKTGRLSCNDPNLQQIPRSSEKVWNGKLKKAFIPKPGYALVACDYSQLEFRLGAAYARQSNLIEIFNRSKYPELYAKEDRDIFTQMSMSLGIPRQDCKTLTYAKGFGAGKMKIAIMLGEDIPQWVRDNYRKPDRVPENSPYEAFQKYGERLALYKEAWSYISSLEASKFYDTWEETYSRIVEHKKFTENIARSRGYINYWTGRRRHFPNGHDAHKSYNSLIQGGGAEIVKSAMIRLFNEVDNPDCEMLLQVHDSVLFEIRESKVDYYLPIIQETMSAVEREIDFGVYFSTEPEYWGQ